MAYGGYKYIEPDYVPDKDDFIVLFWISGENAIEKLAEGVAAESSVGTWTEISTMNKDVFTKYRAHVFKIIRTRENAGYVYIAYPYEHFDAKNMLQFQASVMGNVFGLKELHELYIMDISFPEKYQEMFHGPKFGLEGIRKYMGTDKSRRPHIGTIVKPKVGLTPKEFAQVAYTAWANGLDLVKDDENLVDQKFCPWQERFDETVKMMDKAEKETGEKKLYATNITDSCINRMVERLDYAKSHGHKMVMLDVYVMGLPALKFMLDLTHQYSIFTHAHRAGYSAHHRGNFGVNFQIYEKMYRLAGVDQLHIGTGVGKMEGSPMAIRRFHDIAVDYKGDEKLYLGSLAFKYIPEIWPLFPVASGGVDPGMIENLVALHGKDIVIQAGGGVHGHPKGTAAGSRALRAAVDSVMKGVPVAETAKKNKDLGEALNKFGQKNPEDIRRILEFEKKNRDLLEHLVKVDGIRAYRTISEQYSF